MKIGFTGTRYGMTLSQKSAFCIFIRSINNHYGTSLEFEEFHHGDCIGADAEAHEWIKEFNEDVKIRIHPPTDDKLRAFCKSRSRSKPKPYLARNRAIVDSIDLLIACPKDFNQTRSGTWYTINYARKQDKPVILFL